jgi:GT2 family glycosyltransferase
LDDDVVFQGKDDLEKAAGIFDKPFFREANTAVVTFKVIYYQTKEQQRTALPHKAFDEYRNKEQFLTYYFAGCAHILKKEILNRTGMYPEDFFYGMEEYDLSYRIIREGYSLGYDASITFEHKESPEGRQPDHEKLSSQWVNKSKVARRYLPGIYYYTTMLCWSFEYLRKINGHWKTWFLSWKKALAAGKIEKPERLDPKAMDYLKKVKARLLY